MTSTKRALAWTFSTQYFSLGLQFISTVIIARLLTPEEIGVFSVCMALLSIGHVLRNFGSSQYVIQERELTPERIRTAFTVTLILGWLVAGTIYFLAPFAGRFYEDAGIESVMRLLAFNFAVLPFGSIALALFRREMKFGPPAAAESIAAVVQATTAITLANLGFSYMSLAWASIASNLTTIGILSLLRPRSLAYRPALSELNRVLSYGGKISFITVIGEISVAIPEALLGKTQGFHAVGLLSRGQGTVTLFERLVMRGITPVAGPVFAKAIRDKKNVAEAFTYGTHCVVGLAWLFYVNLFFYAEDIVSILFGEKWMEIVPFVQLWSVSAAVSALTALCTQAFTNIGEINRLVRFSAYIYPLRIVLFVMAAYHSLHAVVLVYFVLPFIQVALMAPHIGGGIGVTFSMARKILFVSLVPAAAAAGGILIANELLARSEAMNIYVLLITPGIIGLTTWFAMANIMRHPLIHELRNLMR